MHLTAATGDISGFFALNNNISIPLVTEAYKREKCCLTFTNLTPTSAQGVGGATIFRKKHTL
jgi:hypothetical protein